MRTPAGCDEMKTGSLRKGSWTAEEDQKLVSYINRYGIWNWSHMPRFAGLSRSGKSCRLRWMNYLQPNLKKGKFSKEEEEIILHFHSLLGNRWSAIATKLPGRTDNEIKNYWHTHLKKRTINTHNNPNNHSNISSDAINDHVKNSTPQQVNLFEDDSSSSSSTTTTSSSEQELDNFKDNNYYDHIGSPGTVDDLQWFWKQLCPIESLEFGNSNFFDHLGFQDSFQDSFGLYNNDFGM